MVRDGTLPSSIPPLMNNQRETISDQFYHWLLNLFWKHRKFPILVFKSFLFQIGASDFEQSTYFEGELRSWRAAVQTRGRRRRRRRRKSNNIYNQVGLPASLTFSAITKMLKKTKAKGLISFSGKGNLATFVSPFKINRVASLVHPETDQIRVQNNKGLSHILWENEWLILSKVFFYNSIWQFQTNFPI